MLHLNPERTHKSLMAILNDLFLLSISQFIFKIPRSLFPTRVGVFLCLLMIVFLPLEICGHIVR